MQAYLSLGEGGFKVGFELEIHVLKEGYGLICGKVMMR
mgnify:CR=1 FL=1